MHCIYSTEVPDVPESLQRSISGRLSSGSRVLKGRRKGQQGQPLLPREGEPCNELGKA